MNTYVDEARLAVEKARQALRDGHRGQARLWAERAAELAPQLEDPWLLLAAVASPRASLEYIQRALKINPYSSRALRGLEWAMQRIRMSDGAIVDTHRVPASSAGTASAEKREIATGNTRTTKRPRRLLLPVALSVLGSIVFALAVWPGTKSPIISSIIERSGLPSILQRSGLPSIFQNPAIASLLQRSREFAEFQGSRVVSMLQYSGEAAVFQGSRVVSLIQDSGAVSVLQRYGLASSPTPLPHWAQVSIPKPTYTPTAQPTATPVRRETATPYTLQTSPTDLVNLSTPMPTYMATDLPTLQLTEIASRLLNRMPEAQALSISTEPSSSGSPSMDYLQGSSSYPTPTFTPTAEPVTIGAADSDERWIDVDLTQQMVTAYSGNTMVNSFLSSTGTSTSPTVTGRYHIYVKLPVTDMKGEDYYLPDVPYTMYFHKDYGLHGTYWHNNFGTPMSHGCVNLSIPDAEWLYNFASVGTLVDVHY